MKKILLAITTLFIACSALAKTNTYQCPAPEEINFWKQTDQIVARGWLSVNNQTEVTPMYPLFGNYKFSVFAKPVTLTLTEFANINAFPNERAQAPTRIACDYLSANNEIVSLRTPENVTAFGKNCHFDSAEKPKTLTCEI